MSGDLFPSAPLDPDRIDGNANPRARWPQTLVDMHAVAAQALRACAARETDALADCVVRALAQYFGGREFYLPKNDKLDLALRDRGIFNEWRGNNLHELCARYNLSDRMLCKIIAEQRELHRRRIQPSLPL